MIIKTVKLTNFRNHTSYLLDCQKNTTLILGSNGWGKTSILEAIYILLRGKSFRAADRDIVKRGTKYYRIELEYNSGESITATFDGKFKTFTILDKKTRRLPTKQKYPVILFIPSDLNLIDHSPSRRRDYFDHIYGQLDASYSVALNRYNKALKQRNELLKTESVTQEALFSWNLLLAQYGTKLNRKRKQYTEEINSKLTTTYRSIAQNQDEVELIYSSGATTTESNYLQAMEQNFHRDVNIGHTSFGVHRDDYVFLFNHQTADNSASRGETRSVILALKFIEADLINDKLRQKPIILLDDVFSELDEVRRRCLIENFKNYQVIITSVESISE